MPRRGENIYKRKDGRWEGRYIKGRSSSGKTHYGYVYARTYREVKQKLQNISMPDAQTVIQQVADVTLFRENADAWLSATQPTVKQSTWNKYNNLLRLYILPEFGPVDVSAISQDNLFDYCNKLLRYGGRTNDGLAEKTIADILSVIRSVLRYSAQRGNHINLDLTSVHIKHHHKELRILSVSEQRRLYQYLYSNIDEYNIGILLCLFTGLRIGELCALRWEDISFSERTIHVNHTMQRVQDATSPGRKTKIIVTPPKSPCSTRTIPIPDIIYPIICNKYTDGTGYFLTNSDSRIIEPRTMQNRFKSALIVSGVSIVNFHVLRHTFATRCVELGFDVKSLSEILGHANVNITMNRYVHPSMELKKQNMQLLSDLFAVS